jgi:tRNA U34 5-methylaminomethyl-2-thiouridine-forming methyltransferase MnmC
MENKPGKIEIRTTKDGSSTLYSEKFSQHYHNPNGAVAESRYVFFEIPGVKKAINTVSELTVFEMGFGTGLNLILIKNYLEKSEGNCHVDFYTVEAFPVDPGTAAELTFGKELQDQQPEELLSDLFDNLKPGMNRFEISKQLTLHLFFGTFENMPSTVNKADFIFHDPFSPEVNSELWGESVFRRFAGFSKPEVVLTTYCAATSARAAMAVGGWKVAKTRGALGKREMTIAALDEEKLNGFKRVNEERLIERYRAGEFG